MIFLPERPKDILSRLKNLAMKKNLVVTPSFREELLEYVKTLRSPRTVEIYQRLRGITRQDEELIISVIGYKAIKEAKRLHTALDRRAVIMALEKLKAPRRHEPKDPDDTCRKTAAIAILDNREEFRDSLPFRI